MHLVPGLAKGGGKIVQLTKSVCGPFMGLSPVVGKYTLDWAEKCSKHNRLAFKTIAETKSITHVVLGSAYNSYFKSSDGHFLTPEGLVKKDSSKAIEALILTIESLKAAGKIPILFSPPPRSGFNIGECLERKETGLIFFKASCDVLVTDYQEHEKSIISALKYVANETKVEVIWLDKLLCDQDKCKSKIDGTFIYRDAGHLSVSGSEVLLSEIELKTIGSEAL